MMAREWNLFVEENGPPSVAFLQSWEWGDALRAQGRTIEREVVERDGRLQAAAQWERARLPLGLGYRYLARGPVASSAQDALALCERLVARSESSHDIFVRCDVAQEVDARAWGTHVRRHTREVQPSETLITDVSRSDDAMLATMHQKTRYNVRVASRHGVTVEIHRDGDAAALQTFLSLHAETARRHGIRFGAAEHYRAIITHLHGRDGAPRAFLASARRHDTTLAMALCVDFAGTRTYVHGASADTHKRFMAPYALHWELMRDARERGLAAYDWWGIAPEGATQHRLAGVTRFKRGFGGTRVAYPPTFDVVLYTAWYAAYRTARVMRGWS